MFLEQFPNKNSSKGSIEVICGSMFSGKTEELIRRLKRAEFAKQKIILVKPVIDDRFHKENVISHQGSSFTAIAIAKPDELLHLWKNEKIVAIDEAQFFDNTIVEVCNQLAKKGVRVIIAGLDMDFKGIPFGPIPQLLCIAEFVTKVHAICVSCGDLAQFSYRINSEKTQVQLGAVDEYKPLCRSCYNKLTH